MPYPTRYPGAVWRPVPHHSPGMILPPRGLLPHVQMGRGSLLGWFSDARSGVSSHLWVGQDGRFEQYVDLTQKAWAEAAGNPYWISCECEGTADEDYTPAQITRLGEIYRWGMDVYGWPPAVTDDPNGRGLGTHSMGGAAWGGHTCPGPLRAGRRHDILAAALADPPTIPIAITREDDDMPSPRQWTPEDWKAFETYGAPAVANVLTKQMRQLKTGDPDSGNEVRMADVQIGSLGEAVGLLVLRSSFAMRNDQKVRDFLSGPLAEWTARQESAVGELHQLVAGGALTGADPTAAADVMSRLDALLTAFTAPRAYTLTPGPAVTT